ncbi:hypothetical protein TKK_0007171 [Trichogramma kaykai]
MTAGLQHRRDFIIAGPGPRRTSTWRWLQRRLKGIFGDFIIGGPGPRRTSSSGDQDQGGLHHRGTRTKEDFGVTDALQLIASLLRGKTLDGNTWRTTVKWRKIARSIGSTQKHDIVKRFVKAAAFDGKDVNTLVQFGLTLEDAQNVYRCHELSHLSETSRAERHQEDLRAMPMPLALQQPPTGPPPNIYANVAVWPPLPQPPESSPPPPPPAAAAAAAAPVREKPRILSDEILTEEVRRLVAAEWARMRREHEQAAKRPRRQ